MRNGIDWTREGDLYSYSDQFGASVSISGDYAIVGASRDDDNGEDAGAAYIFKYDGVNWTEEAKLTARDGVEGALFGSSVSISDEYVVIGAPYDDDNGAYSGSAYLFKRDGNTWTDEFKITASDGAAYRYFGSSVSIDGEYVLVSGGGSAYVYTGFTSSEDMSEISAATKVVPTSGGMGTPSEFDLLNNYPNPFNPRTTIRYALPEKAHVKLDVFNMLGQSVAVLVDSEQGPGYHSAVFEGSGLASGVYIYRLSVNAFVETKRLLLLR
jgi:hypothetical protein